MTPKKYVLFVDRLGTLSRERNALDGLNCELGHVAGLAGALSAASQLEKLSLVVVNSDGHRHGRERFTASLRSLQPRLPLLWLGDRRATALEPADLRETIRSDVDVTQRAAQLFQDEFYATGLADDIEIAAHRVLREFGLRSECSGPYIKASLSALGDLNALIAFTGEELSGYVLLSSTLTSARALHANALPGENEPNPDDLEDLLGEVANRVVGRIKRVFEARSRTFKLKATAFLRGPKGRYRHKASSPSLALGFTEQSGVLNLEFCAERIGSGSLVHNPEAEFLEAGEIHLL